MQHETADHYFYFDLDHLDLWPLKKEKQAEECVKELKE